MKKNSLNTRWFLLTVILFYCFASRGDTIPPPKLPDSLLKEGWCISNNDTINKLYPGAIYIVHPKYGNYLLPKSEIKLADDYTLQLPIRLSNNINIKLLSVADTSKWHPEAIYIILPDRKLTFRLPREKSQDPSGVANLLFQCRKTGEIHLHDTIKGGYRSFNFSLLTGQYDVVLLYNSGKYIRYNNVVFGKNADAEVNMEKLNVQPSDAASRYWLTLRSFNTPTRERIYHKYYPTVSEKKIRGYIYEQNGFLLWPNIYTTDTIKWTRTHPDGYFEIDVEPDQTLKFSFLGFITQEIKIKESCGLILLMKEEPIEPNFNPRTGQP
ncbi:MAG: hypothetical protein PHG64_14135 [Paludibacter sp.]|nr:hypothetical protein [Paludibacter sp.]